MHEAIREIPNSRFVAVYLSVVTGDFYMDEESKKAFDEHKIEHEILEEVGPNTLSFFYASPTSVECVPYEGNIKSFVMAHSPDAIGAVCLGHSCEKEFSDDLMMNGWQYFHWVVPGSDKRFLWRLFFTKDESAEFMGHFFYGYEGAKKWVQSLPGTLSAPGNVTLKKMKK